MYHLMKTENIFKIVIIGDAGCGKTHLLLNKIFGEFKEQSSTIGVDFHTYNVLCDDKKYVFQFWDTAGQERFRTITKSIIYGAKCVLYVYDVTNKKSFDNILFWKSQISEILYGEKILSYLIGNKNDLVDLRQVTTNEAIEFAAKNNFTFFETSAKSGNNIDSLFENLVINLIDIFKDEPKQIKLHTNYAKLNKKVAPKNNEDKKKSQCEC